MWQYHFGRGLVETPNDFGRMGALPTHPALLDWLAVQFRDHGQSIKQLNRLIVTSKTYRQSSRIADIGAAQAATAIAADADNRFLWRMNRQRLDAECVRDAVLAVSGRLDLRMGGPSDRQFELRPGVHVTPVVDYSQVQSGERRRAAAQRLSLSVSHVARPVHGNARLPLGRRNHAATNQQRHGAAGPGAVERCVYRPALRVSWPRGLQRWARQLATGGSRRAARVRPAGVDPTNSADLTAYADKHGLANLCRVLFNANEFLFVN